MSNIKKPTIEELQKFWDDNHCSKLKFSTCLQHELCCPECKLENDDEDKHLILVDVKCNKCNNVLPPHSMATHLNVLSPIHQCPHKL